MRRLFERVKKFLKEILIEVAPPKAKVSWPDKKTVIGSTIVVFVTIGLVSICLGIIDGILNFLMEFIFSGVR
ncbi:MAG: preprotein translocase subunit SecE [bacterium]|nr:preprotein translocase subunit SecE [bacterium]